MQFKLQPPSPRAHGISQIRKRNLHLPPDMCTTRYYTLSTFTHTSYPTSSTTDTPVTNAMIYPKDPAAKIIKKPLTANTIAQPADPGLR